MFFIFSKLLGVLTNPLVWILIGLLASFFVKTKGRAKKIQLATLTFFLTFSNPLLSNLAMRAWEISPYSSSEITQPYDLVIVMGGSTGPFDESAQRPIFAQSADRVIQAVALYQSQKVKKILLSGGSGFVTKPELKEAALLKNILVQMNVREKDIILENNSRNTYENAKMTAAWLKENSIESRVLISSSALHIRRTRACFKKQGIEADYYPVDRRSEDLHWTPDNLIFPQVRSFTNWDALIHEWIGYLTYRLAGYC